VGFGAARVILAVGLALTGTAARAGCATDQVEIRTLSGQVQRFGVEVADDADERAKGLMFREKMPMASGMLFVFPEPKHATFWMQNTPLALDMIFADQAGRVTHVHENAVPMDPTPIDGGPGVAFVLEINAGLAGPMGIRPGAALRHPTIGSKDALWPCGAP
jgi:uncharacterized membrane protein (UPF0127 family)